MTWLLYILESASWHSSCADCVSDIIIIAVTNSKGYCSLHVFACILYILFHIYFYQQYNIMIVMSTVQWILCLSSAVWCLHWAWFSMSDCVCMRGSWPITAIIAIPFILVSCHQASASHLCSCLLQCKSEELFQQSPQDLGYCHLSCSLVMVN